MRIYTWSELNAEEQQTVLSRPSTKAESALKKSVESIVEAVAREGDAALFRYALQYDRIDLEKIPAAVGPKEFADAYALVDQSVIDALKAVIPIVRNFVEVESVSKEAFSTSPHPGIQVRTIRTPIDSCALYVPFGKGRFPSMVYMQGIPAKYAQVPKISFLIPPQPDGTIDPACLIAADLCGITSIYRFGGAHGIAACAYGTESIPAFAKILGPGSSVVSLAKQLVSPVCDTGSITGPSESMIIGDIHADPDALATNILIEAEHGSDSKAILVSPDRLLLEEAAQRIEKLIAETPEPRKSYLATVMDQALIEVDSLETACAICNQFAPEHLQLQVTDPQALIPSITNAGEILIGAHTPFSLANYAGGANAILPTSGYARSTSALSIHDFMRTTAIIEADESKTKTLRKHVATLARYEEFYHHARACTDA